MNISYEEWSKIENPANAIYRPTKEDYAKVAGDAVATQKLYDLEDARVEADTEYWCSVDMPEF